MKADSGRIFEIVEAGKDGAIELLRSLVSIDSSVINQGEYGNEGRAQTCVAERLQSLGCRVDRFEPENRRLERYGVHFNQGRHYEGRPNVVGVWKGTGGGKSLILNGHIDTVAFQDSGWRFPPLSAAIENGKMYGRGTADMKCGVAAMIQALQIVQQLGIHLKGDVIVESVVDEEGGGNGTLACVDRGYTAEGAVITEGTEEAIIIAHRGVLNVEIVVRGLSVHAARKWSGVNAVEKMVLIIQGLLELERSWMANKKHPLLPSPTITVGQIEGGIGATIVPDLCTIRCDVKFLPGEIDEHNTASRVKKEFGDYVQKIAAEDDWLSAHPPSVRWYSEVMPFEIAADQPLVLAMKQAAAPVLGDVRLEGLAGGADARLLQTVGGIPTILFGCLGEAKHAVNENVDLASFLRTIRILAGMVIEWCG